MPRLETHLEFTNLNDFFLSIVLIAVFGYFLWKERRRAYGDQIMQMAIAVIVFHVGYAIERGVIGLWRYDLTHGHEFDWPSMAPVLLMGSVFAWWGLICKILVFGPASLGWWLAASSAAAALVAAIYLTLL